VPKSKIPPKTNSHVLKPTVPSPTKPQANITFEVEALNLIKKKSTGYVKMFEI